MILFEKAQVFYKETVYVFTEKRNEFLLPKTVPIMLFKCFASETNMLINSFHFYLKVTHMFGLFFISIKELVFSNLFVLLIKTCSTLAISLKKTLLIPLSVIPPASAKSIKIYGLFYLLMPNLIQKFYCTSDHCTWIFQAKPCCI